MTESPERVLAALFLLQEMSWRDGTESRAGSVLFKHEPIATAIVALAGKFANCHGHNLPGFEQAKEIARGGLIRLVQENRCTSVDEAEELTGDSLKRWMLDELDEQESEIENSLSNPAARYQRKRGTGKSRETDGRGAADLSGFQSKQEERELRQAAQLHSPRICHCDWAVAGHDGIPVVIRPRRRGQQPAEEGNVDENAAGNCQDDCESP